MKITIIAFSLLFLCANLTLAQFPAGFVEQRITQDLNKPFSFAFTPDGRILVNEQTGNIRVIKNGTLLTQAFATIPVHYEGDYGLHGIAVDPDFVSNHYIYVYYTVFSGEHNVLSRFTASGDTAVPGSETVLFTFEPLDTNDIYHNAGSIRFGIDGKLYVATGMNAYPLLAQDLNSYRGKILRLNKNGTIPNDNPYTSGSAAKRSIWVYGLRNPYSFTFRKGTGQMFINDVGAAAWEEIDDGTVGGTNFGWPDAEGAGTNPAYTNPVYTYAHGTGDGLGCAITGGAFYNPDSVKYPPQYVGRYFYIEHCNDYINMLDFTGGVATRMPFATNIATGPIYLELGPDGNLYYLSRNLNSLYKLIYTGNDAAIADQPDNDLAGIGQSASFNIVADGAAPLHYQWYHKGIPTGTDSSTLFISSASYADSGKYYCTVSNSYSSVTSDTVKLTVKAANHLPVCAATILNAPYLYKGGDTIRYTGYATDADDGVINKSNFSWVVLMHHHEHIHPGPTVAQQTDSGSFVIPFTAETDSEIYIGIYLIVADSDGNIDTASAFIYPAYKSLTLASNPPGMLFNVNGNLITTPTTVGAIKNIYCNIAAIAPQYINANEYVFTQYGSGQTNPLMTFKMPAADTSLTATFTLKYRDGENPTAVTNGLFYDVYSGAWDSLPVFDSLTANATGVTANFNLNVSGSANNYSIVYTGFINVPADDNYWFYTNSDDGSRLWIGGRLVVNNNGIHAATSASGTIALKAGKHLFRVEYFQRTGGSQLQVSYSSPSISKQLIPDGILYRYRNNVTVTAYQDAYVRAGTNKATKFGKTDPLVLKSQKATVVVNNNCETYLMFNLAKITTHYTSAKIKLNGALNGNDKTHRVRVAAIPLDNTTWKENTINFNNRPVPVSAALDTVSVKDTVAKSYTWDITSYINQLLAQKKTLASFVIRSVDEYDSYVKFNSAEASSNKACILFTYPAARMTNEDDYTGEVPFEDLTVMPNPFQTYFIISFYAEREQPGAAVELKDVTGRLVFQKSIHITEGDNNIDIQPPGISKGIYLLTLRHALGIVTRRIEVY